MSSNITSTLKFPYKFVSTRNGCPLVSFSEALDGGLAPDGGLYLPQQIPKSNISKLQHHPAVKSYNLLRGSDFPTANFFLADFAAQILAPFFEKDPLESNLPEICARTFNFPIPLKELEGPTCLLELFHGPTAAFKDVAARFLAECIFFQDELKQNLLIKQEPRRRRLVLVATSGDTGSAIASAFDHHSNTSVFILYPKGRVSPRQEKLLTCWSAHVHAIAVQGSFDDCQRLVKEALSNFELRSEFAFISANSISIGRLLPQMIYYAWSSLAYERIFSKPAGFIIPTGNLGNGFAAILAREMGFPIREIIFSTNENKAVDHFFESGHIVGFPTIATLANAMDVGLPSNMERLAFLFPNIEDLRGFAKSSICSDAEIKKVIKKQAWGQTFCPHTATAVRAFEQQKLREWILVATAHPAKFESVIEPLLSENGEDRFVVPLPIQMKELLQRPQQSFEISGKLTELIQLFHSH